MRTNYIAASVLIFAGSLGASQPEIRNSTVKQESASAGLAAKVEGILQTGQTTWIGYEVQAVPSHHQDCGVYRLEGDRQVNSGKEQAFVLLRTEGKSISKIDVVGPDCHLDGGGVPVEWLTDVKADDSVQLLSKVVNEPKVMESALAAIATHASTTATRVLTTLAAPGQGSKLREKAAFWLGVERGHEGFLALQKLAQADADGEFRKKLTFDVSQNPDPAAVDELIRMAKADSDVNVRGQALFWLAQKAGKKQVAALSDVAANDPEREVKKKAVFALSQLPKEEGTPQLVHVAETNADPDIRKKAIFWLGQSGDPKALAYLEQILKR